MGDATKVLAALREASEKGTPGPWWRGREETYKVFAFGGEYVNGGEAEADRVIANSNIHFVRCDSDARLIALAHNALPALVEVAATAMDVIAWLEHTEASVERYRALRAAIARLAEVPVDGD